MELHERLRYLRKDYLHLSQEEFGKILGVSRSVIKNIELNLLARPDQKEPLIKLVCKEFGISESWLRDGIGDMIPNLSADEEYAKATTDLRIDKDDRAMKIIINYWKLSPENKKAFWSLIDELTEGINKEKKQEQD